LRRCLRPEYGIVFSDQHLDRLTKAGKFPEKLKISYRCVGYRRADIEKWLADRPVIRAAT
jgi:predicted DNA-binding transcriptional regulator AlpA